jgi:hypothetical protein
VSGGPAQSAEKKRPVGAIIESGEVTGRKIMTNVMRTVPAILFAGVFAGLSAVPARTQPASSQTPSPNGAKVYFINLKDGQEVTRPVVVLPPGQHKLQLVLGDWSHVPHAPPVMSNVITVTVR